MSLQNLLRTQGWKQVERIMEQTITDLKNEKIDESLPANEYKIVSLGKLDAVKHIRALLNNIKNSGDIGDKKISYK